MVRTIEYKDESGKDLLREQLGTVARYMELSRIDGRIKMEKLFSGPALQYVSYHKDEEESVAAILALFPEDITINILSLDRELGDYTMFHEANYYNRKLCMRGRILKDKMDRAIYFDGLDLMDGMPIPGTVSKCFYFTEEAYFTFDYDAVGALKGMDSTYTPNAGCWYAYELEDLGGFSWSQVGDYYRNAFPVIPGISDYYF